MTNYNIVILKSAIKHGLKTNRTPGVGLTPTWALRWSLASLVLLHQQICLNCRLGIGILFIVFSFCKLTSHLGFIIKGDSDSGCIWYRNRRLPAMVPSRHDF
jgi:hypothetical protein